MSSAFIKEGAYQHLRDVAPNMASLLLFLKRENGGAIREGKTYDREKYKCPYPDINDEWHPSSH